jgi:hypothetical protein
VETCGGLPLILLNFFRELGKFGYGLLANGTALPMVAVVGLSGILGLAAGALPFLRRKRAAQQVVA